MADYDFRGLSPFDFEVLCHDLLEPELGVKLQAFATGRDKGIDLRHSVDNHNTVIVQCKHYAKSGYRSLLASIKNKELPKIQKLAPKRYVLVTTVDLTPGNVDELYELLRPHCLSKHDIIGASSLNQLLRKYRTVEQSNFKLWLTSTSVLERIVHNGVFAAAAMTREEISLRLSIYVQTAVYPSAKERLAETNVCILAGAPGVGKTTLAELLTVDHMMDDWELVVIDQNVTEGLQLFSSDPEKKQLFYYDDFLGQISDGDKLAKNEDRSLLRFISAISRQRNRRFILTTREYILAKAKTQHERLSQSEIDIYKFVVSCDEYTESDKARILANHLYFLDVPSEHIAALVNGRNYLKIISHRNYNPRVIEWMTTPAAIATSSPKNYLARFLDNLQNPTKLWLHAFQNQICQESRDLLLVLATCGDGVLLEDLEAAFRPFFAARAQALNLPTRSNSFTNALNELEGSFIRIYNRSIGKVVEFQNPSVIDFVKAMLFLEVPNGRELVNSAIFFEQLERLTKQLGFDDKIASAHKSDQEHFLAALLRLLDSNSCRLVRHFSAQPNLTISDNWSRGVPSIFDRLESCLLIGQPIMVEGFRTSLKSRISDEVMRLASSDSRHILSLVSLLKETLFFDWHDTEVNAEWNNHAMRLVLDGKALDHVGFSDFGAIADWFRFAQYYLTTEAMKDEFEEYLAFEVERFVSDNRRSTYKAELEEYKDAIEGLAESVSYDFRQEIASLDAAIADLDEEDDREHHPESYRSSHQSPSGEIDGLFESLL